MIDKELDYTGHKHARVHTHTHTNVRAPTKPKLGTMTRYKHEFVPHMSARVACWFTFEIFMLFSVCFKLLATRAGDAAAARVFKHRRARVENI